MGEHVLVPALVGLDSGEAQQLALEAGVAVVGPDPDTVLPAIGVVVEQRPGAGIQVRPGDSVTVWIHTGDDDGDGGGSAPLADGPLPREPAGVK